MPTARNGWRSIAPIGPGNSGLPMPGPPPQAVPVGSFPPSAGDPDLLPRLTEIAGTDISPLSDGSIMAFRVTPMTTGPFETRSKFLERMVWTGDFGLEPDCGQYILSVTSIPIGQDLTTALVERTFFFYDGGSNNGSLSVVPGEWDPRLYVPPLRDVVIYVVNGNPAFDPSAGTVQRLYVQWSLI